jgi:hypothetical protein
MAIAIFRKLNVQPNYFQYTLLTAKTFAPAEIYIVQSAVGFMGLITFAILFRYYYFCINPINTQVSVTFGQVIKYPVSINHLLSERICGCMRLRIIVNIC